MKIINIINELLVVLGAIHMNTVEAYSIHNNYLDIMSICYYKYFINVYTRTPINYSL